MRGAAIQETSLRPNKQKQKTPSLTKPSNDMTPPVATTEKRATVDCNTSGEKGSATENNGGR